MTYAELRNRRKEKYMNKYNRLIGAGNKREAWNCLSVMMAYQLAERNWAMDEIKSNFKAYPKGGIYDYRNTMYCDVLPDNVLAKLPSSVQFTVTSLEHWIIRREKQYVGDQLAPERTYRFDMLRCTTRVLACEALYSLDGMYKRLSKLTLDTPWMDMIETGQAVVYKLVLAARQQYVIRILGYIVCIPKGKNILCHLLLDNKIMEEQEIDIIKTYTDVMSEFEGALVQLGNEEVEWNSLCDYNLIGDRQRKNRKPVLTMEQLQRQREEEYRLEKLENEAARLNITVEELLRRQKYTEEIINRVEEMEKASES